MLEANSTTSLDTLIRHHPDLIPESDHCAEVHESKTPQYVCDMNETCMIASLIGTQEKIIILQCFVKDGVTY